MYSENGMVASEVVQKAQSVTEMIVALTDQLGHGLIKDAQEPVGIVYNLIVSMSEPFDYLQQNTSIDPSF